MSPTSTRSYPETQTSPDPAAESEGSSQDVPMAEDQVKAEEPEQDENDKCPVCLAHQMINRSGMDTCNHEFCLDCLKHWVKQAGTCPVCRQEPKTIITNIREQNEKRFTIGQLMQEKEEEERSQRGQAVPLTSEKEIITKRKHELNRIINEIQGTAGRRRTSQVARTWRGADNTRYQEAVTERQGLQMLLDGIEDGSSTRQHVVSHPLFRTLIYLYDCEWSPVDASLNTHLVRFVPRVARENSDAQLARIRPFIANELLAVPLHPMKRNVMRTFKNRNAVAKVIFEMCLNWQIHSPQFLKFLMNTQVGMSRGGAERFQHELFEFASSQISMEEHFKMSSYSLPGSLRGNPTNFSVGGLSQPSEDEIITLNDTAVDDDEPEVLSDNDEPIFVGTSRATNNGRNESNYLRDEPMSSGSEGREDDLFQRRACRMPSDFHVYPMPYVPQGLGFTDIVRNHSLYNPMNMNAINPFLPTPRYEQLYPFPGRPIQGGADDSNSSNDVIELDGAHDDSANALSGNLFGSGNGSTSSPNTAGSSNTEQSPDVNRLAVNLDGLQSGSSGADRSYSRSPPTQGEGLVVDEQEQDSRRRRSANREDSDESHAAKYRKKMEKYHKNISSDNEKQRSIDWMTREIRKLEKSMSGRSRHRHHDRHSDRYSDRYHDRHTRNGGFP